MRQGQVHLSSPTPDAGGRICALQLDTCTMLSVKEMTILRKSALAYPLSTCVVRPHSCWPERARRRNVRAVGAALAWNRVVWAKRQGIRVKFSTRAHTEVRSAAPTRNAAPHLHWRALLGGGRSAAVGELGSDVNRAVYNPHEVLFPLKVSIPSGASRTL